MRTLSCACFCATAFLAVILHRGDSIALSGTDQDEQLVGNGLVSKTIFNSKMRLVFLVGLEGSGHHYLHSAIRKMFQDNRIERLNECHLTSAYYLTTSMTKSPLTYAGAHARANREMGILELQGRRVSRPGSIALLTSGSCRRIGQLSYPNYGGEEKVQQYIDVRMLAEVAEARGVDLRLIYLKRPAKDMVIANTEHRSFVTAVGDNPITAWDEAYMKYMRVLFTDIAAMHSGLAELGPGFVICHDFAEIGNAEQASRIAEFIAPNTVIANMTLTALQGTIKPHREQEESPYVGAADVVIQRLQGKLDVLESVFCPK